MQEVWVRPRGWEDPLEEAMATRSTILAWEIPWTEESGRLQSIGWQRVRHDLAAERTLNSGANTVLLSNAACDTLLQQP